MAAIDNAYRYFLSSYGNRISTRQDAHKKSELRDLSDSIKQINKEAPLYKMKTDESVAKFAIGVKESAQNIQNTIRSLSGSEDILKALQKKVAISSDEDIASVKYLGGNESAEEFDLEVRRLAKSQLNIGNTLSSDQSLLSPDTYAFDLSTTSGSYEFQYTVHESDTNYDVQTKLANLITNAKIGLKAYINQDTPLTSSLRIESVNEGLSEGRDLTFTITAKEDKNSQTALAALGFDRVSRRPENAKFLLNGTPHTTTSNSFTIDHAFQLNLHGVSPEDDPVKIGFQTNTDTIADNIATLASAYNQVLYTAEADADQKRGGEKLRFQMSSVATRFRNELSSIGLAQDDKGFLSVDRPLLADAIHSESPKEQFSFLNGFKADLEAKAASIALNPMNFVDKVIVAYKNPGHNFPAPYFSSLYSGMLVDRYL
ncbi:hypothetical protein FACS1894111_10650 [Clostridia bacterium]|nr:hypothetical protein FACS1894111_10650 [Clostridia bacterium]